MGDLKKSVYCLMQIKLYYESIWLKIRIAHSQRNLWNGLENTGESQMVAYKLSFIVVYYYYYYSVGLQMGFCLVAVVLQQDTTHITQNTCSTPHSNKTQHTKLHTQKESKAILVTSCGGLWDCEKLRIPHYPYSRLKDGGYVVSLTRRPLFALRHLPVFISVTGWVNPRTIVWLKRLGALKQINEPIGSPLLPGKFVNSK
jgi:hypothetical protein